VGTRPSYRWLALLALVLSASTSVAATAPAKHGASRQPFVGTAAPGLSTLAGNEVLVILNNQSPLSLAANGRAAANSSKLAAVLTRHGLDHWRAVGAGRGAAHYVVLTSSRADFDARAAAREVAATGAFRAVAPNLVLNPFVVPNDPYINANYEWYVQSATAGVSLPAAWDVSKGDTSIVIAVMDNGIDINHPDLKAQVWTNRAEIAGNGIDDDNNGYVDDVHGWDFGRHDNDPSPEPMLDPSGIDIGFHGTFVSGVAVATTNDAIGIAGAGWGCRVMPLKISDAAGQMTLESMTEAMGYLVDQGASVLNMSFGTPDTTAIPYFQALVDDARAAGIVCVSAAGNDGLDKKSYPAACDYVLAVGATDATNARASFSNYGDWVKVAAPGSNMFSLMPQNYTLDPTNQVFYLLYFGWDGTDPYIYGDGTSFSSPVVAGVCGLVRAHNHSLTPQEVMAQIIATGDVVAYDHPIGLRLNAYRALTQAVPLSVEPPSTPSGVSLGGAWPNPFATTTTIDFAVSQAGPVRLGVYDVHGRMVRDLIASTMPAGRHTALWDGRASDGRALGSGVYFVVLERGGVRVSRRIVLAR
jgi:subtilisin family serine protease